MAKECLMCGEDNLDNAMVCHNCGSKLPDDPDISLNNVSWVITCPKCGKTYTVSGPNSRINSCDFCHDEYDKLEIANSVPVQVITEENGNDFQESTCLVLAEIRHKETIRIQDSGIIGRMGDISTEFFATDFFVSEEHCKILRCENTWQVEHLGHTNPTSLNGIKLQRNVPMTMRDGDRLRIADLVFKVTIEINRTTNRKEEIFVHNVPKWVVVCPICGKKYYGDSSDFKVNECTGTCSYDDFDKYEIANVSASFVGE